MGFTSQRFVLRLSAFLQNLFVVRVGEHLLRRRLKGVRDLVGGHILERRGNRVWIPTGAGCQNPKVAMESRGSVAGMLAAAVFAAAVFAASMALAVRVLMMVAMHGRVEIQRAVHQRFRRSIRIAADAAEQADARIGQRGLCAAADAAADQRVHAALH